jgi:hypothetical protein
VLFVVVAAGIAVWAVVGVALAMITGAVVRGREMHDDRPLVDEPRRLSHLQHGT